MKSKPAERNSWTKVFPTARRRCSQASCLLTASPPSLNPKHPPIPPPKIEPSPSLSLAPAPSRPLPGDPPLSPLVSGEAAMEVVAPSEVTAAPFALCPRFNLLAVGMASAPAAPGSAADPRASRVDVLRLLRPSGEHDLGRTLQVDCVLQAPGLRRVAWSSTPTSGDQDDVMLPIEQDLYPAGLLAGGFNNGAVRLWDPKPAILCDMKKASISSKPTPVLMLSDDAEKAEKEKTIISETLNQMYSELDVIRWEGVEYFKAKAEEDWELISREEPVSNHHDMATMNLLTETCNLHGPVLGLSFSEVHPYLMASAALGERIDIHDLHYPFHMTKKKLVLGNPEISSQTTCLKWSSTYPTLLASTSEIADTKLWDIRSATMILTYKTDDDKSCCSDLEFSLNDPRLLAVSSVNNGSSAAVKIWDIRNSRRPCHQYGCGAPGVLSLSWNRSGQLLASHKDGRISCYDPYKKKIMEKMDFMDADLGLTWTHSDDTVAAFSSSSGVTLAEIGWLLEDGL